MFPIMWAFFGGMFTISGWASYSQLNFVNVDTFEFAVILFVSALLAWLGYMYLVGLEVEYRQNGGRQ
jgi:hypothetical protein